MDRIARRGAAAGDDLPQLTDDELVAWGATLAEHEPPRRRAPLRAADAAAPRRRRPLVADPQ